METVELRWNKGILECRCLLIHEHEEENVYFNKLFIDWKKKYSDWKPVLEIE